MARTNKSYWQANILLSWQVATSDPGGCRAAFTITVPLLSVFWESTEQESLACLELKPLLQILPQPVLTCAFAIHVLCLQLAHAANSLVLHFVCILANFPAEKDVFPFLFLCSHPEMFLISCCAIPRLFPTSTKQHFNSHPLSTSHQSERIGIPSHNRWGTQWNEVKAAITHTSFMSHLLKGAFCWCEGIFLFLFLEWHTREMWRWQPRCHTGTLKPMRQAIQWNLLAWPQFSINAAMWYEVWCWQA